MAPAVGRRIVVSGLLKRGPAKLRCAGGNRRGMESRMLRLTVRYARYALSALSGVGFGIALN